MKIATLGPKGTFSEQATEQYLQKIKQRAEIIFCKGIAETFNLVNNNEVDYGIVPLENLLDGSVGEVLDLLYKYPLYIIAEIVVEIHHCIASLQSSFIKDIRFVISHPKAIGQCLGYIRKNNLSTLECLSTAEAMKIVAEKKQKDLAAIGHETAAKEYGLKILEKNIEDKTNNVTRFIVISKTKNREEKGKKYKTSIAIHPTKDRPGLLHDLIEPLSKRKINLTRIESRPTKFYLGEYVFYIDLEGHENNRETKEAFKEIGKLAKIKIFGSYEKVY